MILSLFKHYLYKPRYRMCKLQYREVLSYATNHDTSHPPHRIIHCTYSHHACINKTRSHQHRQSVCKSTHHLYQARRACRKRACKTRRRPLRYHLEERYIPCKFQLACRQQLYSMQCRTSVKLAPATPQRPSAQRPYTRVIHSCCAPSQAPAPAYPQRYPPQHTTPSSSPPTDSAQLSMQLKKTTTKKTK